MKIKIKKGLSLRLEGQVELPITPVQVQTERVALYSDDFEGFIPKQEIKEGMPVKVGQPVLYHKNDSRIKIVSPVSGNVIAVERGFRRHIDRVILSNDGKFEGIGSTPDLAHKTATQLIEMLAESGLLVLIRRRPYADIPKTDVLPRDIFVSAFDSSPLATDRIWTKEDQKTLQAGANILSKITKNKVYISKKEGQEIPSIKGVEEVTVKGHHPSGLPGVQAANIAPVNKGDTIWTLSLETMWRIGRYVLTGYIDPLCFVAVCGSCVSEPYVAKTVMGAQIDSLLKGRVKDLKQHIRVISGNVLTGIKEDANNGYVHFPYTQITLIPEGDDVDEFMSWASVSPKKMSISPSFPGRFLHKVYNPDARINGGKRAIIMSGEYDKVLPMDIMTEYLIKAINKKDIEQMEKLGIYEIAPEDVALAECIDSSKQPLQKIIREGLDFLRNELE